jgi:hypothetical protein
VVSRPWLAGPPGRDEQHRARAVRRHPRVSAVHPPGCPAAARLDRRRGRPPPPGQGPRRAGTFLLIAGEDGQAWCEAARQLAAEADIPLDAVRIGHLDGDCHDPRCAWQHQRQIASDGAVLVRPDRFIAWRYPAAASDPLAVLTAALSQILGRRPFAQAGPAGS